MSSADPQAPATAVASANEETAEAWDGVLFDRFVEYRHIVTEGLGAHGVEAMRAHPPNPGERVLDVGCGFGDTSQDLARLVGAEGRVHGVDIGTRFIEAAMAEAERSSLENLSFEVADVQTHRFADEFDYAFARFGTMFFANPVPALRNVREALRPGGRLVNVVWRRKLDNEWLHRAEQVVERFEMEETAEDEPTCGPGPFSMADADTTTDVLRGAGFDEISLRRCDREIRIGDDLDDAVGFAMALGPAGEMIRLAGDRADELRPKIVEALTEALAGFVRAEGVYASASTWIVSAVAP